MSVKETFVMLFFVFIAAKYVLPNIVRLIGTRNRTRIRYDYYMHQVPPENQKAYRRDDEGVWIPESGPHQLAGGMGSYGKAVARQGDEPFDDVSYLNDLYYRD